MSAYTVGGVEAKWTAHFQPEAWINNQAVSIDGAESWDCTEYITSRNPNGSSQKLWHAAVGLNEGDSFVDSDDEMRLDNAAPTIVREHRGPFTITVTREVNE